MASGPIKRFLDADGNEVLFTENDTGALITFDDDRDLTGYTVTLRIDRPAPASDTLEIVATLTDATNGIGNFSFTSGDLIPGDDQSCEIEFDDGAGTIITTPCFIISVKPEKG